MREPIHSCGSSIVERGGEHHAMAGEEMPVDGGLRHAREKARLEEMIAFAEDRGAVV